MAWRERATTDAMMTTTTPPPPPSMSPPALRPGAGLRERLQSMLHAEESVEYRRFMVLVTALVLVSCALLAVEQVVDPASRTGQTLADLDLALLQIFLLEYALRVLTVSSNAPRAVKLSWSQRALYHAAARLRYMMRPTSLADLAAVMALVPWLRSLRVLRVLRLIRTARLFRYYNPFHTLSNALRSNGLLLLFAFGFFAAATLIGGVTMYAAEVDHNPNVKELRDTFYWAVVTLTTVGYGDISPATPGGRLIAVALMLSGMCVLALFTGVFSQTLVGHILPLRKEQVRMSTIANHIVIFGWSSNVPLLLSELRAEYGARLPPVVVCASHEQRPAELDEAHGYVPGEPTREAELGKVRLAYATTVIIVGRASERMAPSAVDAQTVLTLFTIRSYERKLAGLGIERSAPLHLCCEILDPENIEHAQTAGADEIVLTARLSADLLAHASAYPGMSDIFSELLRPADQNVYIEPLREIFHDAPPAEGVDFEVLVVRLHREQALVLGYEDGAGVHINPPPTTRISPTARLIYIAHRPIGSGAA